MRKQAVIVIYKTDWEKEILEYSRPFIQKYAEKCDADYIETYSTHGKLELYNTLKDYMRVISFNSYCLIREDTPNLFNIVPDNQIGLFNEGQYINRVSNIATASELYKLPQTNFKGEYFNTGVIVASRIHRFIFKNPHFYEEETPKEDLLINIRLLNDPKNKIYKLSYIYNRLHFVDDKIGIVRHDSYILNYEGAPTNQLFTILPQDIQQWKKDKPWDNYKRNIVISVSAGMGDQLCSEPVIRYIKNKIFPDANIIVASHFPRLFSHIEGIKCMTFDEYKNQAVSTLVLRTCPDDDVSEHHMSHVMWHPTDFASMSTIKQVIPNKDKTIQLSLDTSDFSELIEICDISDLNDMVIIHAGKWWPSKTLPIEWWQEIINKLDDNGIKVGLIGKTIDEKQGFLPLECPPNGIDFRDMTSLGGLIALISQAGILITNDSSPLHIAGAFDNWIVTFSTCKEPDNILPWRKSTQYYKTISMEKKLLLDDLETNWLALSPDTIDIMPKGKTHYDYLPSADEVVQKILDIKANKIDPYYKFKD